MFGLCLLILENSEQFPTSLLAKLLRKSETFDVVSQTHINGAHKNLCIIIFAQLRQSSQKLLQSSDSSDKLLEFLAVFFLLLSFHISKALPFQSGMRFITILDIFICICSLIIHANKLKRDENVIFQPSNFFLSISLKYYKHIRNIVTHLHLVRTIIIAKTSKSHQQFPLLGSIELSSGYQRGARTRDYHGRP